jgi:solute carrier family 25 (mitochondrial phosphate transporter), member 3
MGKQVSFDVICGMVAVVAQQLFPGKDVKLLVSMASAFLASIVACIFSQPGDMILTAASQNEHLGFAALVSKIYGKHGLGGFFLGIQARLAHVASIITVQLVVYDMVKIALGLPVTGSH